MPSTRRSGFWDGLRVTSVPYNGLAAWHMCHKAHNRQICTILVLELCLLADKENWTEMGSTPINGRAIDKPQAQT